MFASDVQYITRFALMENSFGSSEHAQTLMEHVLTTYPGRIPSWMTYIDMLTKSGQINLARYDFMLFFYYFNLSIIFL